MAYLYTVIDLFNNEPVAWNITTKQDKYLSIDTIKKLAKKTDLSKGLIHSNQGVHYTNNKYIDLLKELKVEQSMSRKGNCWDNAVAESFFSRYKSETIYLMGNSIKDLNDVINITKEYMDYYINFRPQQRLGGIIPSLYKSEFLQRQLVV